MSATDYEILQELISKASYNVGDTAYAIDHRWMVKMKLAQKRGTEFNMVLNNSRLLSEGILKKTLIQGYDFEIIPKEAWNMICEKYFAQPEIPIPVERNVETGKPELLIFMPQFKVIFNDSAEFFHMSYFETFEELRKKAIEKFHLSNKAVLLRAESPYEVDNNKVIYTVDKSIFQIYQIQVPEEVVEKHSEVVDNIFTSKFPIYNSQSDENQQSIRGITGFINNGNTCFFNAVLQCLLQTKPLVQYFRSDQWRKDLSGKSDNVAKLFASIVDKVWGDKTPISINPSELLNSISTKRKLWFESFLQQDSQEYLQEIINKLLEAVNTGTGKDISRSEEFETDNPTLINKFISEFREANKSPLADMIHSFELSTFRCRNCGKAPFYVTPASNLFPPIPTVTTIFFIPYGNSSNIIQFSTVILRESSITDINAKVSEKVKKEVKCVYVADGAIVEPTGAKYAYALEIPQDGLNYAVAVPLSSGIPISRPSLVKFDDSIASTISSIYGTEEVKIENMGEFEPHRQYPFVFAQPLLCNIGLEDAKKAQEKLPTPGSNGDSRPSLVDCLRDLYMAEDVRGRACGFCNVCGTATVERRLVFAPQILIVVLMRFTASGAKNSQPVDVPEELDIGDIAPGLGARYRIYGAVTHRSDFASYGHYTALVRHMETGMWYNTSDVYRSAVSSPDFSSSYIFFYEKIDK